jgi:hypothetical protein
MWLHGLKHRIPRTFTRLFKDPLSIMELLYLSICTFSYIYSDEIADWPVLRQVIVIHQYNTMYCQLINWASCKCSRFYSVH